jgi:hypothetical protein
MTIAPLSSGPADSVPGARLVNVQNPLKAGPWGQACGVDHEARPQRQAGIERAPGDIPSRDEGLAEETQCEDGKCGRRDRGRDRRQQAQTRPGRCRYRYDAGRTVGRIGAADEDQPEPEKRRQPPQDGQPREAGCKTEISHRPRPLIRAGLWMITPGMSNPGARSGRNGSFGSRRCG